MIRPPVVMVRRGLASEEPRDGPGYDHVGTWTQAVSATGHGPLGTKQNPYLGAGVVAVRTGPVWTFINASNIVVPKRPRVRLAHHVDGPWVVQAEDLTTV
jgi:hypothetical protein